MSYFLNYPNLTDVAEYEKFEYIGKTLQQINRMLPTLKEICYDPNKVKTEIL